MEPYIFDDGSFAVRVVVAAPAGAVEAEGVPRPDVSRLPGAVLVSARGWDGPGLMLRAGCARGPSGRFAPGLEEVLFEKATWLTLTTASIAPEGLHQVGAAATERTFSRELAGTTDRGAIRLTHVIAFSGEDRDLVLCSAVCAGTGCADLALELEGTSAPPPDPSWVVRGILAAAAHPAYAAALIGAFLALGAAALLWRRPYPRP